MENSKKLTNQKFIAWLVIGCMFSTFGSLSLLEANTLLPNLVGPDLATALPPILFVIGIICIVISLYIKLAQGSKIKDCD